MTSAPTFEQGLALYRQGRLEDAEAHLHRVLTVEARHFDVLYLLGLIAAQTSRLECAVALISRAIGINATVAAAHLHLGNALRDLSRLPEALASYDTAVSLRPDFKEAHKARAILLLLLHRPADALASFDAAIALGADEPLVHVYRSSALIDLQRPREALASSERAIASRPDLPAAHANRAGALYLLGRYEDVLAASETAIALQGACAEAHAHRGAALYALMRLEDALASLDRAIALQPQNAPAHNLRALCLLDMQMPAQALAACDRAIELHPELSAAFNTRGLALGDLQQHDLAIASFDRAIALRPEVSEPYFNKGCRCLLAGIFATGWDLYERRPTAHRRSRHTSGAFWDGKQALAGKTIHTYAEQGLGDTLQFCRYAKLLEARGARVALSVQDCLRRLLRSLGPSIELLGATEPTPACDFYCPLLSLPKAFRTDLGNMPAATPYLYAEPERVAKWRQRLGPGRLIGIRWQGSTGRVDCGRSFPVSHLQTIAGLPGVRLISLQRHAGCEQLRCLPSGMQVEELGEEFEPGGPDAFLDAAAVMACLDLVITSDTAIAHLAGALGRPTWVALKCVPDWRWLLGRDDSPWYPTMRLFRQPRPGDWDAVFAAMRSALLEP